MIIHYHWTETTTEPRGILKRGEVRPSLIDPQPQPGRKFNESWENDTRGEFPSGLCGFIIKSLVPSLARIISYNELWFVVDKTGAHWLWNHSCQSWMQNELQATRQNEKRLLCSSPEEIIKCHSQVSEKETRQMGTNWVQIVTYWWKKRFPQGEYAYIPMHGFRGQRGQLWSSLTVLTLREISIRNQNIKLCGRCSTVKKARPSSPDERTYTPHQEPQKDRTKTGIIFLILAIELSVMVAYIIAYTQDKSDHFLVLFSSTHPPPNGLEHLERAIFTRL